MSRSSRNLRRKTLRLGLGIGYDTVRKHKGAIYEDAEVGRMTTFALRFPTKKGVAL